MCPYVSLFVFMGFNGSLWNLISVYAFVWVLMGSYRSLCILIDCNGLLVVLICYYTSLWVRIVPFASVWLLMGPYRSLFVIMDSNGSLWA